MIKEKAVLIDEVYNQPNAMKKASATQELEKIQEKIRYEISCHKLRKRKKTKEQVAEKRPY